MHRWWLAFILLLGGCSPRDPLDRVVSAESATALSMWRSSAGGYLSGGQLQELDAAVSELKLGVMNHREATGTAAVEEAMRAKIHGRTVRDVLRLACETKIKRLEVDLKGLMIAAEQNSRLVTRPGDTESGTYLAGFRERQQARRAGIETELNAAQARLRALAPPAR